MQSLNLARAAGIDTARIVLDPGYGFGKTYDNNYPLLAHLDELLTLGQPLLAGISRKSFLARTLSEIGPKAPAATHLADIPPEARTNATLAATTAAILAGASIVRVHEVRTAREAASIADAILRSL
jgi:dihydropteroate synthase